VIATTERPDATIHYHDSGAGAAVLLIHGGLMDPMDGERFWITPGVVGDLAAAGYRTLVPDRRFHAGRTSADFGVAGWGVEVDDLLAVLDAAGIERAHVVAGSNGCTAAVRLALRRSRRVRSLVLCWPAAAENQWYDAQFERAAAFVADAGPAAYVELLRRDGLPRPGEQRPGFAYGASLLHDERCRASFVATPAGTAASVFRETARLLLPGEVLRGLSHDDLVDLDRSRIAVHVVPPGPEDSGHTLAATLTLCDALPGAIVTPPTPVAPSSRFPASRERFRTLVLGAFAAHANTGM
jgi:pimeloyl-ACP methyl ester carboxylesterase